MQQSSSTTLSSYQFSSAVQDPIDSFIGQIYRATDKVPADSFRQHALEQLRQVIPFDGAIWSNGSQQKSRFNSHTLVNISPDLTKSLIDYLDLNPLLPGLLSQLGNAVDMSDLVDDQQFYQSPIYHQCFKPHGIERILSSLHLDTRSGIFTVLTLYRFERDNKFSEAEKLIQNRLLFHILNAANHSWALKLKQKLSVNSYRAICDQDGVFHQVQPEFLDLIEQKFNQTVWPQLPFNLSELRFDNTTILEQGLTVKLSKFNQLVIVDIWATCPADGLSEREIQVMNQIKCGQTTKQVAKTLNLAPSTVSNHLYRIFEKLGIKDRSELAKF